MKSQVKRVVRRLTQIVGWKLVRTVPPAPLLYPPTKEEQAELTRILRQFTSAQDSSDKAISSVSQWQDYLSDQRISFFGEIIALLKNNEISLTNKTIADFGSGTGYLLRLFAQHDNPSSLVGIDSYAKFNELGKLICPSADFFESLQETNQQFDLIFCTEVLEHLTKPQEQMMVLYERLKPSGVMLLTVPDGRKDTFAAGKQRVDGGGYWGHINFWSPESWTIFTNDTFVDADVLTGLLSSNVNYALVKKQSAKAPSLGS